MPVCKYSDDPNLWTVLYNCINMVYYYIILFIYHTDYNDWCAPKFCCAQVHRVLLWISFSTKCIKLMHNVMSICTFHPQNCWISSSEIIAIIPKTVKWENTYDCQ